MHAADGSASDKIRRLGGVAKRIQESRRECIRVDLRAELNGPKSSSGVPDFDFWIGTPEFLFYELKRRTGGHSLPARAPRPVRRSGWFWFLPKHVWSRADSTDRSVQNERRGDAAIIQHRINSFENGASGPA